MVHGDFRQRESCPPQAKRNGTAPPPPLLHGQEYIKGRINIAMSKLKQMYPTKQIVVMTPVHRALFASGDKNIQPDEMYENARGIFFDEYVKAIKETGNVWAVPVIDLNSLSGLFPLYDAGAQMFNKPDSDRLHPNDAGHSRMAKTIMQQLSALPCVF